MINKTIDLSQYKAPGVYFLEFDASEYTQVVSNTIRLVVGFSKKGVYNRPVLITNKDQAIRVYGDIDTTLESRGSFFHRSLFTCLEAGPVLALALLPVNNGQDTNAPKDEVEFKSFSLDLMEENSNKVKSLYSAFFNKERYWELDSENFDAIIKNNFTSKGKLFSIVNLGQKEVSLIVRKASVQGWKVTAQEFYGSSDVPSYLQPTDVLEDFFIEVIALEGVWDDYSKLSTHPLYSRYFDVKGIKKDRLNAFLSDETVKFLGSWVGSVIPNLTDGNGKDWSVDTIINQSMAITGVYATLNKEILENYDTKLSTDSSLDLVGHSVAEYYDVDEDQPEFVNMLSYFANFDEYLNYTTASNSTVFENTFVTVDSDEYIDYSYIYRANTSSGMLNNLIKIEKPVDTSGEFYETYVTLKNNLSTQSILQGSDFSSNVKTTAYFGVSEVYESVEYNPSISGNQTYLNVVVKNPQLLTDDIENTYDFTLDDAENKVVNLTAFPEDNSLLTANLFPYAYVKPKNANSTKEPFYVQLITFNYDSGNSKIVCQWDSVEGDTDVRLINFLEEEDLTQWEIVIPQYFPLYNSSGSVMDLVYSLSANYLEWDDNDGILYAYPGTKLFNDVQRGSVYNGLTAYVDGEEDEIRYIKIENVDNSYGTPVKKITFYSDAGLSPNDKSYLLDVNTLFYIVSPNSNVLVDGFLATSVTNGGKTIKTENNDLLKFKAGDYVATQKVIDGENRLFLIPIISVINNQDGTYTLNTSDVVYLRSNSNFICVKKIENVATNYTVSSIKGLKLTDYHLPGNFLNRQQQLEKILGVVAPGTNIYKALSDNETTRFRYIIDTFSGGLTAECFPKNYLTRLARDKQRCLAIMNAPSIKEFKESTTPLFKDLPTTDDPAPALRIDYIRDGGNPSSNSSVRFSLPSEENGSKFAGFFISYPLVKSGRNIIPVPPSAGISNRFVSKHTDGTKYNAVAGKYGSFSVTGATGGLEYNFTTEERGQLAEIGLNPIVWRQNSGYTVYDDLMAYQRTLSAFNNLSLRDLLITIEEGIDSILTNYLFDNNTEFLRNEITSKLTMFLQSIKTGGGVTEFRVTMNEVNNTSETITAGFGIVDVEIEPAFPIRKFITRITVNRAGGLSQSGFSL